MFKKVRIQKIITPISMILIGVILSQPKSFAEKPEAQSKKKTLSAEKIGKERPSARKEGPRIPSSLHKHSLGIGVGQTFLVGKFEDYGENQITWDLLYTYSASHSFDFLANFHSEKYSFKQQWFKSTGLALGIKGKIYQFDAFSPYGLFGFGFYSPKAKRLVSDTLLLESSSKTTFGWHMGAGADLRLNHRYSTGLLFQYHNPFDVKQEIGPEVKGSYAKMLITGMYTF